MVGARAGAAVTALGVLLLFSSVAPRGGGAQTVPQVTVGVRPGHVRVGETFVVTVRVSGPRRPDDVVVEVLRGAELVDEQERASTGVGVGGETSRVVERELTFRATVEGVVEFSTVRVVLGGESQDLPPPEVTVAPAGLDWGRGAPSRPLDTRDEPPLLPEGVPPRPTGRTGDPRRVPYGAMPYGTPPQAPYAYGGYGAPGEYRAPGGYDPYGSYGGSTPYGSGSGYGVYGSLPPGEGWAATAPNDPWWPELRPELDRYTSLVEDPAGLARLEAGLTPERVFVGQQVTLVATATFPPEARYRMSRDPEFYPPGADNAWVVAVPYAPPLPAAAGGRLEEAHTFMRAFFPVQPGRFTVDAGTLLYSAGAGGYGRTPQDTLTGDALSVEVLPVPERDAPPGWRGAVGRYGVRAWVAPEQVGWGESALLTVEVSGVGYLPAISRPDPGPVWGGGLRPLGERAWVEVRDGVVGGVKRFTWLVVPVEPGPIRLGPVIYSFFDPYVGAFGQVATDELTLDVAAYPADYERLEGPPRGVPPFPDSSKKPPLASPPPPAEGFRPPQDTSADAGPQGDAGAWQGAPPAVRPAVSDDAFTPALVAYRAGRFEQAAARWEAHLASHPGDAAAWYDLGVAYGASRPGEGWSEWAWTSGLRHAPRDARLRSALFGDDVWVPGPGLPWLPLGAGESLALAALLGLGATATLGGGILRLRRARAARHAVRLGWISAAMILFALAAMASGPWRELSTAGAAVVTVSGPVTIRHTATASAAAARTLPAGVTLHALDRYGSWIRVETPGGPRGWVDEVQAAPLEPVRPAGRYLSLVRNTP